VIEGQLRRVEDGVPLRFGGVGGRDDPLARGVDEGEVGDADHPPARVAFRLAESVELFQVDVRYADLLFQFAGRGPFQRLVDLNEAAGQSPSPFERLLPAPDQQDFQIVFGDGEDHQINCD
jgi:hypothetical protein